MSLERVGIVSLGAKIPERVMENEEWSQYVDTTDEWIRTRTGIERRHIVAAEDTTASLAAEAARDALDRCGLCADDIDEIIVATDTPEVYLPDTSCFVQELLEARAIPSFTLGGSGCAGFVQALDIAASRVRTCHDRILVIGVEILSRIVSWEDRSLCVLFLQRAPAPGLRQRFEASPSASTSRRRPGGRVPRPVPGSSWPARTAARHGRSPVSTCSHRPG